MAVPPRPQSGDGHPSPSASPPAPLSGPNTYDEFKATVLSVKKVTLRLPNSDTSYGPPERFLEVRLAVEKSETFMADTEEKWKDTPKEERLDMVYVSEGEKVEPGDLLEGRTRPLLELSRGWRRANFLESYRITPRSGPRRQPAAPGGI